MDKFFVTLFNAEPVVYGVVILIGIATLWYKLVRGRIGSFLTEAGVFWLVFSLHGGTMTGGMAAAVAALLAGFVLPTITWLARTGR